MREVMIDIDRIQRRLNELAKIGKTDEGGVTCLAYTDKENEAFRYLLDEIPQTFDVKVDSVGNAFATPDPAADKYIFVGSHLDSVRNGGRFDGRLGVVTALEAIQTLDESGVDQGVVPTLAIFRAEETARFNIGLIGSRCALGLLEESHLEAVDDSGVSLRSAMTDLQFEPPKIGEPTIDIDRLAGFIELHIEQGPVLDAERIPVGVVTEIRGILRNGVIVRGLPNHSGGTPMGQRKDALAGAAEMILAIETVGKEANMEGDIVTTVGDIKIPDASANKVSGEVSFPIDIRSVDTNYRAEVDRKIQNQLVRIANERSLIVDIEVLERIDPVVLDSNIVEMLENAAEGTGTEYMRIASGGGHDAMNFAKRDIPAGMLFVACDRGLSHNPNERVDPETIEAGTTVLARALRDFRYHQSRL